MRLFIAVDLSDDVRDAIAAEQKRIAVLVGDSTRSSVRWVQPAHMHLTLVFLGEVAEDKVPRVVEATAARVEVKPFTVMFEGLGVFPPHGAPRVLWLGVGEGGRQLVEIERLMVERLTRVGIALEGRPYHPHLTLGRWRAGRPADTRRVLEADRRHPIARLPVDGVTLYQSRLSSEGPTHTALARVTLT